MFRFSVFMLMLFSGVLFSSYPQTELKQVQEKYASLNDFSADVKQSTGNQQFQGKVYYMKGDKYRVELKNAVIVSDGETIWNHNKKQNKVIVNSVDPNDPGTFSLNKMLNEIPAGSKTTASTESGKKVLTVVPNKKGSGFDSVKLWLNDDNLITRFVLNKNGAKSTDITLSNYKVNQNVNSSLFTMNPPEGSEVIDLR